MVLTIVFREQDPYIKSSVSLTLKMTSRMKCMAMLRYRQDSLDGTDLKSATEAAKSWSSQRRRPWHSHSKMMSMKKRWTRLAKRKNQVSQRSRKENWTKKTKMRTVWTIKFDQIMNKIINQTMLAS